MYTTSIILYPNDKSSREIFNHPFPKVYLGSLTDTSTTIMDHMPEEMRRQLEQQLSPEMQAQLQSLFTQRPGGAPPASRLAFDELGDFIVEEKHVAEKVECQICLEPLKLNDSCKEMPCRHVFHDLCLLDWLKKRNSCPLCRHELPSADEDYEASKRAPHRHPRDSETFHMYM
eukprot:Colp12_sorted_trinity150504_noHs@33892